MHDNPPLRCAIEINLCNLDIFPILPLPSWEFVNVHSGAMLIALRQTTRTGKPGRTAIPIQPGVSCSCPCLGISKFKTQVADVVSFSSPRLAFVVLCVV
jgi:hypothetical protein